MLHVDKRELNVGVQDYCDGSNIACPTDVFSSAGTVCRSQSNFCDPAEACSGGNASCPADIGCNCWGSPSWTAPQVRSAYVRKVVALQTGDDQDPVDSVKSDNVLQICGMNGHLRSFCAKSTSTGTDSWNEYKLGKNGSIVGELYPAAYSDLRIFLGENIGGGEFMARVSASLDGQVFYRLGSFGKGDAIRVSSSLNYWVITMFGFLGNELYLLFIHLLSILQLWLKTGLCGHPRSAA